jgi:mannose-6-phosphate isomerase-like protein (cupin superfamily)
MLPTDGRTPPSRDESAVVVDAASWLDDPTRWSGSLAGESAGAAISVIANELRAGDGVAAHHHPYSEVFIVRSGTVDFHVGGRCVVARAGQILVAPANVPHSFSNPGPDTVEMIDIHQHPRFVTIWD